VCRHHTATIGLIFQLLRQNNVIAFDQINHYQFINVFVIQVKNVIMEWLWLSSQFLKSLFYRKIVIFVRFFSVFRNNRLKFLCWHLSLSYYIHPKNWFNILKCNLISIIAIFLVIQKVDCFHLEFSNFLKWVSKSSREAFNKFGVR
jgi:hypothetical protein